MPTLSQKRILNLVAERLDPHFASEAFERVPSGRADELKWTKVPDEAPGDERDRVAIRVSQPTDGRDGVAIRGWAWSWTRTAPVNLRVMCIEHREAGAKPPSGWLCTTEAAVTHVLEELERIVHGQLIGWLDEPVPLGVFDGTLPELSSASEVLLGGLVIPSGDD